MATFVLVPGFWLGAWAWEEVARGLRAAGHEAVPLTLTGVGERAGEATPQVNVDTHIADVLSALEGRDLGEVVLVAHSGGNMPVTGVSDRIGERLRRVVYVDTGPLPDGMAQIEFNPPEVQEAIRKQVAEQGDGYLQPMPDFDRSADPVTYGGLTDEHIALIKQRGTPEPFGAATQALRRADPPPPTPFSVIACTFAPEQVEELAAAGLRAFSLMKDAELRHLPTGHWPMFSRPADLSALLAEYGA